MPPARRALFLLAATAVACGSPGPHGGAHGLANEIEGRLLAPCCWIQTLDIHESELATRLRAEIDQRVEAGERAEAIEDDMASRYGERIRAVPRGKDPRKAVPALVGALMAAALGALLLALRRWVRASRPAEAAPAPSPRDEYDERIDEELARIDEG